MEKQMTINYPARASQFFALIEEHAHAEQWQVNQYGGVTKFIWPHWFAEGDMYLCYRPKKAPTVEGVWGGVQFPLHDLFEKGKPWDPEVYRSNPYMPAQHKQFLDALFALFEAAAGSAPAPEPVANEQGA